MVSHCLHLVLASLIASRYDIAAANYVYDIDFFTINVQIEIIGKKIGIATNLSCSLTPHNRLTIFISAC